MNDMMNVKLKFRSTFWLKIMKYSIYSMDKNYKQNRLEFDCNCLFGVSFFLFFLQREMKCFILFVCLEPTKEANYIYLFVFVFVSRKQFWLFFISEQKNYFLYENNNKKKTVALNIKNSKRCSLKEYGKLTNVAACKIMFDATMRFGTNAVMYANVHRCKRLLDAMHVCVCERARSTATHTNTERHTTTTKNYRLPVCIRYVWIELRSCWFQFFRIFFLLFSEWERINGMRSRPVMLL